MAHFELLNARARALLPEGNPLIDPVRAYWSALRGMMRIEMEEGARRAASDELSVLGSSDVTDEVLTLTLTLALATATALTPPLPLAPTLTLTRRGLRARVPALHRAQPARGRAAARLRVRRREGGHGSVHSLLGRK